MIETILLTIGVLVCVSVLGMFLLLMGMSDDIERHYLKKRINNNTVTTKSKKSSFASKLSNWYLSKGAMPFWCVFIIDCFILVFSQLMAAYLVMGGQILVPSFWNYVLFAICSLPFFFIGMKLFRSYETIVRFSWMEDLARIVCATFAGMIMVDIIKHFIPTNLIGVYPIWQEQLVMMICAVLLMWSMRIITKTANESSYVAQGKIKVAVYGSSIQTLESALAVNKESINRYEIYTYNLNGKKEANEEYSEAQEIIDYMKKYECQMLFVSNLAFPNFFLEHKLLISRLIENNKQLLLIK